MNNDYIHESLHTITRAFDNLCRKFSDIEARLNSIDIKLSQLESSLKTAANPVVVNFPPPTPGQIIWSNDSNNNNSNN